MTKIDLSSVYKVTAKGHTYFYAWRPAKGEAKEARLHEEPGSPAFVTELAGKLESRQVGDRSKLKALIVAYKREDGPGGWLNLSAKTRESWIRWLDAIQIKWGKNSLAAFDRPMMRIAVRKWRDKHKATPRAADMAIQVFSHLLSYGVAEGRLTANICFGIKRLYRNDRSCIIWEPEDLAQLEPHASPEIMLAARLAALSGIRQADLLRLSWGHIKPFSIEIRTGKSSQRKTTLVPIYAELRALLDSIPKRATTLLVNTDGVPWRSGFGSSWGAATERAGIDKHFHDLRGTAATKFYLAGLTIREIAEIMTWDEEHVETLINMYVDKERLLRDRIRRMDEAGTRDAKPPAKPLADAGA